jgi:8-oxo-dGTP pyrophosphatase MutT (NUDIX family)
MQQEASFQAARVQATARLASFDRRRIVLDGHRAAAVAVALCTDASGDPCFLLTRRARKLRTHSGQWALPGGRIDAGESAAHAARRELHEELGLALGDDAVLGLLDDYATRSGFVMTPVVVWAGEQPVLAPNPDEVAKAYVVPLAELDRPDAPRFVTIPESDRPVVQMPLLGNLIHAPTAAILLQLREVVVHGRSTRVAHYEQPVFAWK